MLDVLRRLQTQVWSSAENATPVDLRIGMHWTVAAVERNGQLCGGIAATLEGSDDHHWGGGPAVRAAGDLLSLKVTEWLALLDSPSLLERSIGLATLNALLDVNLAACREVNAEQIILERGAGRKVAFIGHFPFVERVRAQAAETWVLELNPRAGDLPAEQTPQILPQADVIAITATTLLNDTFDEVMRHRKEGALVIMLGGTAPLSPLLFEYGVDVVAGTYLTDPRAALLSVSQGATFKQIRGKRLLTLTRSP